MAYRYDEFVPGEIYHLCTRGADKREIFRDEVDYGRFCDLLKHCLPKNVTHSFSIARRLKMPLEVTESGEGLIDILGFCLMTNHVHLLIKENEENGTSQYMQRLLNSYAKYFNCRYKRSGPLFTCRFKAVLVNGDEQLMQVSRYIHLNPYVAHMTKSPFDYKWSSLRAYVEFQEDDVCHTELIRGLMNPGEYRSFVADEADYARTLTSAAYSLIDYDD